jgi:hypothetical protein
MIPFPYMLLAAALACAGCYGAGRWQQYRADEQAQQAAITQAVELARVQYQRTVEDQQEIARHAKLAAEKARTDARAGDLHARQLRGQLDAIRQKHSAAATGGEAAGDPIGVLAHVLERADQRARILAEHADAARTAGQACERAYDALGER